MSNGASNCFSTTLARVLLVAALWVSVTAREVDVIGAGPSNHAAALIDTGSFSKFEKCRLTDFNASQHVLNGYSRGSVFLRVCRRTRANPR